MALAINMGLISLVVQFILLLMIIFAFRSVSGKQIDRHCKIMNAAVILQLISVLIFMAAQMSSFTGLNFGVSSLGVLVWLHHLAGLLVFMLALYINMALKGSLKFLGNPYRWMKITFIIWILVFVGGVIIYLNLWQGIVLV